MVALAQDVRELGEVDSEVGELPQPCWGQRRDVSGRQAPRYHYKNASRCVWRAWSDGDASVGTKSSG